MPATYAHYKFGDAVYQQLPQNFQDEIDVNRSLYNIGVHGPDLLFYYHPLKKNVINQQGAQMHDESARPFFEAAQRILKQSNSQAEWIPYIYGFITHFILDSECHALVFNKTARDGTSHSEIEVEFDRMLAIEDGFNPVEKRMGEHLKATAENAKAIAPFFPGYSWRIIQKCIEGFIQTDALLTAPGKMKRNLIYNAMKVIGKYEAYQGLIVNKVHNPKCDDSNQALKTHFDLAVPLAVNQILAFKAHLRTGESLSERYNTTYCSKERIEK